MATKPRLLHFISELDVGGSELALAKLLPYLQPHFDNHVACLMGQGAVGKKLSAAGISVHYLNISGRFSPVALTRTFKLAQQLGPAGVVGHLLQADLVGRLTAARLHRPFISNQRSSLAGRDYLRSLDFATQRYVSRYVVQTAHAKKDLQRRGLVPARKITVIQNLVEEIKPANSRENTRRNLGIPLEAVVVTCVSNLRPGKGHHVMLEAFHKIYSLLTTHYSLHLLLIGDGPQRQTLKTLAKNLGIAESVRFLGLRHDIPDLLAASDVFVLPSEAEGMSNALLEAMAAGLPCVASDIPANRAILTDHVTGRLFTVNNSQHLAATIQELLANLPLSQSLGVAAQEHIRTHHDPDHIAQLWRALLLNLLS